MPKLKLSAEQKLYRAISGSILRRMRMKQLSDEEMSRLIGCYPSTFTKKRNHPEQFRLPEFITIVNALNFSDEELLEGIKHNYVPK